MKKATLLLAALLLATGLAAQNPTLYFMEGSTYRSQLNPAYAPQRGYVNLPGIGGMEVGINGNVALDNISTRATGGSSRCSTAPCRPTWR